MKRDTRKYIIRRMTEEEIIKGKHHFYHYPRVIEYRGKFCILSAGDGDNISIMRYGNDFFVLSTRSNMGYAGVQLIDSATMEEIEEFFLQDTSELEIS